jgi:hypothetical protein
VVLTWDEGFDVTVIRDEYNVCLCRHRRRFYSDSFKESYTVMPPSIFSQTFNLPFRLATDDTTQDNSNSKQTSQSLYDKI